MGWRLVLKLFQLIEGVIKVTTKLNNANDLIDFALEIAREYGHKGSSKEKLVRMSHVLVDVLERSKKELENNATK